MPLALLDYVSSEVVANQATCFYQYNGSITNDEGILVSCRTPRSTGDFVNCCHPGDECLSDNIYHFTHPPVIAGDSYHQSTGYYLSSCTDPTHSDPTCTDHCTTLGARDITYNVTSNIWACCVAYSEPGHPWSCLTPGNETWQGTPEQSLSTLAILPSSTSLPPSIVATSYTAFATTETLTSSASATPTSSTSEASSTSGVAAPSPMPVYRGLSSGAKTGVGVGVVIDGLATIGVVAFLIWHFHSSRRRRQEGDMPPRHQAQLAHMQEKEVATNLPRELDASEHHEMAEATRSQHVGTAKIMTST